MPKNPMDTNWIIGLDGDKPLYGTLSEGVRRLATADFALENPETTTLTLRLLAAQLDAPEQAAALQAHVLRTDDHITIAHRAAQPVKFATGGVVRPRGDFLDDGAPLQAGLTPVVCGNGTFDDVLRAHQDANEYTAERALAEVAERDSKLSEAVAKLAPTAQDITQPKHLLDVVEDDEGRKKARFGARPA